MFLLLCFVAGLGLAVQAVINANLGVQLQSPWLATLVSLMVSLTLVLMVLPFTGSAGLIGLFKVTQLPGYLLLGGVLGALFLLATIIATPRIGAVSVFCLIVAGQVTMSLVLDGFRSGTWQALSVHHWIGALLVLAGAVLVNLEKLRGLYAA